MKAGAPLAALLGLALVAATTHGPGGTNYFNRSTPPNPQIIRVVGRSHLALISDLFWVRAISASVAMKVPADGLNLIAWCGLVADLDPKFLWPYVLGGLLGTMSFDKQYNAVEADALLSRGVEAIPDDYRLALYLSYNQLNLEKKPAAAAQTLLRGSRNPNAPLFMAQLATRLLVQSSAFDAAHSFASELEATASTPEVRDFFRHRRLEIERDSVLEGLQKAVDAFRAQRGELPGSLTQLLAEGFIPSMPTDPLGGTFSLGADGLVSSTSGERLRAFFQPGDE